MGSIAIGIPDEDVAAPLREALRARGHKVIRLASVSPGERLDCLLLSEPFQGKAFDGSPIVVRIGFDGIRAVSGESVVGALPASLEPSEAALWIELALDRRRLETELAQAERSAAVGRVVAGLLHEIKNPLNNLLGAVHRLVAEERPETGERWTDMIRRNGELLRIAIHRVLGGLRGLEEVERVAVHELIDQALAYAVESDVEYRDRIAVSREFVERGPVIEGIPGDLLSLFLNLLANAREALAERPQGRIVVRTTLAENRTRIEIEDDGVGIPPDRLPGLFKDYGTSKVGGTGIGLRLCHSIVEKHHGAIFGENLATGGARFTVELPAHGFESS